MKKPRSTIEILKYLDKSNCRECGHPACLAFALAVFKGEAALGDCPRVNPEIAREYDGDIPLKLEASANPEAEMLSNLQRQIENIDLSTAAVRTGGRYADGRLVIKIFGKDFSVDARGGMASDIHINQWVAGPVLNYVIESLGVPPSGKWVPLRELESGRSWNNFFIQRCEKPLKKVADTYTDFFKDIVEIFNGKPVESYREADVSLVIHPLPLIPLLICYWEPEDDLPSTLNLFFDANVEKNLPIRSIYGIGAGLAVMFEKLAMRHG